MKQIEKRTLLLGAAALCWGIMFPEYLFTTDSYTAFVQEAEDMEPAGVYSTGFADGTEGADGSEHTGSMTGTDRAELAENSVGAGASESGSGSADELYRAVRSGKVRYRFRIYEYLKNHLFSRMEYEGEWNAFLRRELCAARGDAGVERGIVYLWSIRDTTNMRRSEYLTRESAG